MTKTFFAPELYIPRGTRDVDFYIKAFGAVELRRFSNDDGTIHVSELSIDGALFHLHEETRDPTLFDPKKHNGTTVIVGLFVPDVHAFARKAIAAGAKEVSAVQDYDYGYRQARIVDPYGHVWMIEQRI
jgi:PhnB protein